MKRRAGVGISPWWSVALSFACMGVAFLGFGLATANLLHLFRANFELFANYGLMVIAEGGLRQFVELTLTGYAGLACYTIFKFCEHRLVDALNGRRHTVFRD